MGSSSSKKKEEPVDDGIDPAMKALYNEIDADNNGFIEKEEFMTFAKQQFSYLDEERFAKIWKDVCEIQTSIGVGDDKIDLPTFAVNFDKLKEEAAKAKVEQEEEEKKAEEEAAKVPPLKAKDKCQVYSKKTKKWLDAVVTSVKGEKYGVKIGRKSLTIGKDAIRAVPGAKKAAGGKKGKRTTVAVEYRSRLMKVLPANKKGSVSAILSKNKGKEHAIYLKVCKKYKKKPEPEYKAIAL